MRFRPSKNSGFTLIELMVSLAIFVFMTAFLLAKYGTFNQSTLLVNLAYDTALTIRSAQSYGLNVQGTSGACSGGQSDYSLNNACFAYPYGVDFNMGQPTQFVFFTDINSDGGYGTGDTVVSMYNMNKGYSIASLCVGSSAVACTPLPSGTQLDITFKRPVPDAIIKESINGVPQGTDYSYAKIVLTANNATASVVVQSTGEVSVGN